MHFAHYLKRRLIHFDYEDREHPWFDKNKPEDQGFTKPSYHITRSTTGAAKEVRAGDTIWLLSQLETPWGKLPPSLDGRIEVSRVRRWTKKGGDEHEDQTGLIFHAGEGSTWHPLFNASPLLKQLKIRLVSGKTQPLLGHPRRHVGQALQSMRQIENPDLLEKHVQELDKLGFDFISYRLADGTRAAFRQAKILTKKGSPFFWDRWSLPRGLAERREIKAETLLTSHLEEVIRRSKIVWGIASPRYAEEKSYSAAEKNLALRYGKLQMVNLL